MMLAGANDTNAVFLNNRDVLKKAQDELDNPFGLPPSYCERDIEDVSTWTIKRPMRLHRTTLIVNLSKIHYDPQVWSSDQRGSLNLSHLGPGEGFVQECLLRFVAPNFCWRPFCTPYEFTTLDDAHVDMTESSELTNMKATPLDVLIAPP
ncbi:hypothetical protein V2J09_023797 [Rumex salicifolius]